MYPATRPTELLPLECWRSGALRELFSLAKYVERRERGLLSPVGNKVFLGKAISEIWLWGGVCVLKGTLVVMVLGLVTVYWIPFLLRICGLRSAYAYTKCVPDFRVRDFGFSESVNFERPEGALTHF